MFPSKQEEAIQKELEELGSRCKRAEKRLGDPKKFEEKIPERHGDNPAFMQQVRSPNEEPRRTSQGDTRDPPGTPMDPQGAPGTREPPKDLLGTSVSLPGTYPPGLAGELPGPAWDPWRSRTP